MENKTLFAVSGAIFTVIAIMHLLRSVYSWSAVFNNWTVPLWISYLGLVLAGALAYLHWDAYRNTK